MIHFDLKGPGWQDGAVESPRDRKTYFGRKTCGRRRVNRVILRAGPQVGKIVLTATSEGLQPASVALVSAPVGVTGGLSLERSAYGITVLS